MKVKSFLIFAFFLLPFYLYCAEPPKSLVEQCKQRARVDADTAGRDDKEQKAKIYAELAKRCDNPQATKAMPEKKTK